MGGPFLSSKIVVVEEEPQVRGIPSAPTAVIGAVGITQRGPIGKATLVTSFEAFQSTFGGFTHNSDLTLAAMGFFENGGTQLWVVRTAHYADTSDASTITTARGVGDIVSPGTPTPAMLQGTLPGPFTLAAGDVIVLRVDGGSEALATFNAGAAQRAASGPSPYPLTDGATLTLHIDGGPEQVVIFASADFDDIGSATPEEVAAVINATIDGGKALVAAGVLTLASDTEGTSSSVEVIQGTAQAALLFPSGAVLGTGNVANLAAVTLAEVKAIVEAAIAGVAIETVTGNVLEIRTQATGSTTSVQVGVATAAAFGLDTELHSGSDFGSAHAVRVEGRDPGAYANRIEVEVRAATSGDATEFDLLVVEDGVYRESFPNLSMHPNAERYIEHIVNAARTGSVLIRVLDQHLPEEPVPTPQRVALSGGDDGLTDLDDNDFVGNDAGKTGLYALDQVQDLTLLIVPGRATPAVHNAMVRYCEVTRGGSVFAVLDPPSNHSASDIVTYVTTTAALQGLSEYAAIYWPQVLVLNPSRSVFGDAEQIAVPPSGILTGIYARTDGSRPGGVYDPPAGIDKGRMFGVLGFETLEVLEESKRDLVYPKCINPLTTSPGQPRFVDGSRTLKRGGNFPYIAERRGVIFIERSLKEGLSFARHRNNTEGLRAQVRRTITAFLITQMNNGAFRSREPAKAFFVDVSDQLNTPTVIFSGKLIVRVGLATNKPAEFIELRIAQDTRALEAQIAGA